MMTYIVKRCTHLIIYLFVGNIYVSNPRWTVWSRIRKLALKTNTLLLWFNFFIWTLVLTTVINILITIPNSMSLFIIITLYLNVLSCLLSLYLYLHVLNIILHFITFWYVYYFILDIYPCHFIWNYLYLHFMQLIWSMDIMFNILSWWCTQEYKNMFFLEMTAMNIK